LPIPITLAIGLYNSLLVQAVISRDACELRFFLQIIKQNWNQFLLVVKATAQKPQISNFYPQTQRTNASHHIYVSQWSVTNVKASFFA